MVFCNESPLHGNMSSDSFLQLGFLLLTLAQAAQYPLGPVLRGVGTHKLVPSILEDDSIEVTRGSNVLEGVAFQPSAVHRTWSELQTAVRRLCGGNEGDDEEREQHSQDTHSTA